MMYSMYWAFAKIFISAGVIAFASWLSDKRPELAGFIMALPIATLLALAFSFVEFKDAAATVRFAKSVFVAVPLSLLFFVPFLLAEKLQLPFWGLYTAGIALLATGYFIHLFIMKQM